VHAGPEEEGVAVAVGGLEGEGEGASFRGGEGGAEGVVVGEELVLPGDEPGGSPRNGLAAEGLAEAEAEGGEEGFAAAVLDVLEAGDPGSGLGKGVALEVDPAQPAEGVELPAGGGGERVGAVHLEGGVPAVGIAGGGGGVQGDGPEGVDPGVSDGGGGSEGVGLVRKEVEGRPESEGLEVGVSAVLVEVGPVGAVGDGGPEPGAG